jgi:hypothetical protein
MEKGGIAVNDPHVERLYYTIASGSPQISYSDPEPMKFTNQLGSFSLAGQSLEFVPSEHFSDEDQARAVVERFLRDWELATDLRENPGAIRFAFERAQVIDRSPPLPGEPITLYLKTAGLSLMMGTLTVHLTQRRFPEPPQSFLGTTDVELGFRRWSRFREGKEPLPAMAYFVLKLLETRAGDRHRSGELFGISHAVLNTLGRLSQKGDALTARKVKPGRDFDDLTGAETSWLDQVVRRILLRMGEHAAGAPLTKITMADFPSLGHG